MIQIHKNVGVDENVDEKKLLLKTEMKYNADYGGCFVGAVWL